MTSNFSFVVFNGSDSISKFNLTWNLSQDLAKIKMLIETKIKTHGGLEYDRQGIKSEADVCKPTNGFVGNYILQALSDFLKKTSDFEIKCPLTKGLKLIRNFPVVQVSAIPRIVTGSFDSNLRRWELTATIKGKTAKMKAMSVVFRIKIYGVTLLM
jgi:hypothetical protein